MMPSAVTDTPVNLANLPLNCPRCGQKLRYLRARTAAGEMIADSDAADDTTIYVYHCATHGPFQFSRDIPLRPGS